MKVDTFWTHGGFVTRTSTMCGIPLLIFFSFYFYNLGEVTPPIWFYLALAGLCAVGGVLAAEIMWWAYFRNFADTKKRDRS